jgi:hypothetical protein
MSIKPYVQVFGETLVSPKYYGLFLKARFRSNFIDVPHYRRWMAIAYTLATLGLLYITNGWLIYVVVWVIPTIVLYPISALIQFSTEHAWGSPSSDSSSKSHARFCGEAPPTSRDIRDWSWWWFKVFFYHLPIRIGVLSAELIHHDLHHLLPKEDKAHWCNLIYARQQLAEAGLVDSVEYWGIHQAAQAVFQNLAAQVPLSPEEIDRIIKG